MVSFTSVTKQYGSRGARAVDSVSLCVTKGEFVALLGPNGAGKTTLVKMLLDLVRPTHGAIAVDGVVTTNPASRCGVGYLPENIRIPAYLSGRSYLKRITELSGMRPDEAAARIEDAVGTVGMKGKERDVAKTYSKGMMQRIGLAAALLTGTKLLVLDEPVSGLDPIGIRDVRRIMETVRQSGVTILLNSHLLSEVEKTCDAAAIINKGKIALQGKLSDIVRGDETLEDVFVRVVGASHA